MSDILDTILDIDTFNKQFEAGQFDHLTLKKTKLTKNPKDKKSPVISISYTKPTAVLPYITKVSCETCHNSARYLTGWGIQTPKKAGFTVSTVNTLNNAEFNKLFKAKKFSEPYVTELLVFQCEKCCVPSTILKDC